jgi:hypothetical protein
MAYVRAGMGQINLSGAFPPGTGVCDPGSTLSADGSVCESTATYSAGSFCTSPSFPFFGTYAPNAQGYANCVPFSATYGLLAVGVLALVIFRGGRR